MNMEPIREKIEAILEQRKAMLPKIEQREGMLQGRQQSLKALRNNILNLKRLEKDQARIGCLDNLAKDLDVCSKEIERDISAVRDLRGRFSRDTICIGVSGMARVGKSTTLQKMSGLTDNQIPTGNRKNVTAVHSIIHNSSEGKPRAKVSFMSKSEFLDTYISELVEGINANLSDDKKLIAPSTLQDLEHMSIPDTLGETTTPTAGDSLLRLREAKESVGSYRNLLTGLDEFLVLEGDNLKQYVAYPEQEVPGAGRPYLAVKGVEIYCPFPSIPDVRLSLVDLPGFGEIHEGVARKHVAALNKNVDHILDILKPTDTSGSYTSSDAHAIELLYSVLPAVTSRRSLITVGINVFDKYASNAEQLETDFNMRFNEAQDCPLHVELFHANDEQEVFQLFGKMLDNLANDLPGMDQDLLDAASGSRSVDELEKLLDQVRKTLTSLAGTIPLREEILNNAIGDISRSVIRECQMYENRLSENAKRESEYKQEFDRQVDACYQFVEEGLSDGFFLGENAWGRMAPAGDYYSQYRKESRRIRREIIARYEQLNVFYSDNCEFFKKQVLKAAFQPFGNLFDALSVDTAHDADRKISSLRDALSSIVRNTGVLKALDLLESVKFSFRHNVFLNIAPCLDELLNPYRRDSRSAGEANEVQVALGGIDDPQEQIERLRKELLIIGRRANDSVRKALKGSEDRFFEYLSVCMSFFIDFLWRQDEDSYRQVVVRKLVGEYPEAILGESASLSRDEMRANEYTAAIKLAAEMQKEASSVAGVNVRSHEDANGKRRSAHKKEKKLLNTEARRLQIGDEYDGVVSATKGFGAFVKGANNQEGLVHVTSIKQYFNVPFIKEDEVHGYLSKGMKVRVRVEGFTEEEKVNLSLIDVMG